MKRIYPTDLEPWEDAEREVWLASKDSQDILIRDNTGELVLWYAVDAPTSKKAVVFSTFEDYAQKELEYSRKLSLIGEEEQNLIDEREAREKQSSCCKGCCN